MNNQLTLYVGDNCHLCSDAEALLKPLLAEKDFSLRKINIGSEPILQKKLALRIPVLRLPSGAEHNWPFNWSRLENELDKDQS
jgi:glutaredoxin